MKRTTINDTSNASVNAPDLSQRPRKVTGEALLDHYAKTPEIVAYSEYGRASYNTPGAPLSPMR